MRLKRSDTRNGDKATGRAAGGFSRARLALSALAGGLSRRSFDRNALMSAVRMRAAAPT